MTSEKQPSLREIVRTISAIINENGIGKIEIKISLVVVAAIALYFAWQYLAGLAS